jgi:hypothetical protein
MCSVFVSLPEAAEGMRESAGCSFSSIASIPAIEGSRGVSRKLLLVSSRNCAVVDYF